MEQAGQLQFFFQNRFRRTSTCTKKVKAQAKRADLGMFHSVPYKWGGFQEYYLLPAGFVAAGCFSGFIDLRRHRSIGLTLYILFICPPFRIFPETERFSGFIL
jgi:hypothetical protein